VTDEVARWRDAEGVNPASLVLESLRPTLATQPLGMLLMLSSPLGLEDAHARAFAVGESPFAMVAHAPTWVANETLTEEATHELEPDSRVWRREYAAEAQASALSAFDYD
jgi:hypothetical protein